MTKFPGTGSGESHVRQGPPPGAQPLPYPHVRQGPPGPYPLGPYPPGGHGPLHYPGFPPPPPNPRNGLAVAAVGVGIVALLTSPLLIGFALGIAAVAMGVSARRRVKRGETTHNGGLAILGVVLGIVATCIGLVVGVILGFGFATGEFNEDYQHCLLERNGMSQYCEQYR
jgi:hypothetical protein